MSKALIKLYEEPNKPDDPVNFVRRHMGSEDFFILGDGNVTRQQNAEEEMVLSSLIEKKSEEKTDGNVEVESGNVEVESSNVDVESGTSVIENTQVANAEDCTESEDTGAANVDLLEGTEEVAKEVDLLKAGFEKLKSNADCNSILKTHLTDEIFEKIKSENTDGGIGLYDCIHSGLENPDAVLGIYATNLQFYDQLSDIFDPVIGEYHSFGKDTVQPDCDWGDSSAFEPFDENNEIVLSVRICCMRNVQDYPVVCKMEEADLNNSLAKVKMFLVYLWFVVSLYFRVLCSS